MAKQRRKAAPFPHDLLGDIAWSFDDQRFATREAFIEVVREYDRETRLEGDESDQWRPDEVVLWAPRVRVTCEYWDDPEELTGGAQFDEETGDLWVDLTADCADGFTAGELLYKVQTAFGPLMSEGDHHFFEGLHLVTSRNANPNAVPVYEVWTGS